MTPIYTPQHQLNDFPGVPEAGGDSSIAGSPVPPAAARCTLALLLTNFHEVELSFLKDPPPLPPQRHLGDTQKVPLRPAPRLPSPHAHRRRGGARAHPTLGRPAPGWARSPGPDLGLPRPSLASPGPRPTPRRPHAPHNLCLRTRGGTSARPAWRMRGDRDGARWRRRRRRPRDTMGTGGGE